VAIEQTPVIGGVAKAAPLSDYASITCGCDEAPVRIGTAPGGSVSKSTQTPKSFNKDAFVQSARFGGR